MESPSPPDPVPGRSGTVQFRPVPAGRPTLAALGGLVLAGTALSWLILAHGRTDSLPYGVGYSLALLAPAAAVALVVLDRCGVTRVGPDGVRNTRFWITRKVAWHEMAGFEVRTTLAGRSVRLLLKEGRPVTLVAPVQGKAGRDGDIREHMEALQTLAATYRHAPPDVRVRSSWRPRPRTSLLVLLGAGPLLVAAWSPWLGTSWPGRREASGIADPCALAGPLLSRWSGLPAGGSGDRTGPVRLGCRFSACARWGGPSQGLMSLKMQVYESRRPAMSGSGAAARHMALTREESTPVESPGSGIELQWMEPRGSGFRLMGRRANVVVDIYWAAPDGLDDRQATPVMAAIARRVLNQVPLK